ncbi:hypothetical protein [Oricola indica]|uniref:hypothetical protein n=1 Tax=Oricola indica TaxID=2872591 RepID=UPI001CC001BE|nr:hypothetical protein [Oricola indica]
MTIELRCGFPVVPAFSENAHQAIESRIDRREEHTFLDNLAGSRVVNLRERDRDPVIGTERIDLKGDCRVELRDQRARTVNQNGA